MEVAAKLDAISVQQVTESQLGVRESGGNSRCNVKQSHLTRTARSDGNFPPALPDFRGQPAFPIRAHGEEVRWAKPVKLLGTMGKGRAHGRKAECP